MPGNRARLLLVPLVLLTLTGCIRPIHPTASTPMPRIAPADALVIRNGTVIPGNDAGPIPDGLVIIQGERILAVGRAADWTIPAEVKVIDAQGGTILPGIINAHARAAYDVQARRLLLEEGVTAICDLATPFNAFDALALSDTEAGPAARGFRSGPIITAPGGYPPSDAKQELRYEVAHADEARAAVQDLAERGVDVINIALDTGTPAEPLPSLDLETARAIVEESHARGLLVRAHVSQAAEIATALELGVNVLEYSPLPPHVTAALEAVQGETEQPESSASLEELLGRAAEQGVIMVPLLEAALTRDCEREDLMPEQQQACRDERLETVRRFHEQGGQVAVGCDYAADPRIALGLPLREMQLLQEAGLSPLEVIRAATSLAAQVSGHNDLGVLGPSKVADVIVVAGDPLADLQALQQVRVVIQGGQVAFER